MQKPGLADRRSPCPSAGPSRRLSPAEPARHVARAVRRLRQNLAPGLRRCAGLGAAHASSTSALDDGGRSSTRPSALCQFLPGPNVVNLVGGVRVAHSRRPRRRRALVGLLGPPVVIVDAWSAALFPLRRNRCLRRILAGDRRRRGRAHSGRVANDGMPLIQEADWRLALIIGRDCSSPSVCCGCRC